MGDGWKSEINEGDGISEQGILQLKSLLSDCGTKSWSEGLDMEVERWTRLQVEAASSENCGRNDVS